MVFAWVLRYLLERIKKKKNVLKTTFLWVIFSLVYAFKKRARKGVFAINFHFGKCLEKMGKNRFEINAICIPYETLCGDKFEKHV